MNERDQQRAALEREIEQARERLHEIAGRFDDESWTRRPGDDRWSAAECVKHLTLSSEAFLPIMRAAVDGSGDEVHKAPAKWRAGWFGSLFTKVLEPPVRLRVKSTAPFVPQSQEPRETLLSEFDELQAQLATVLRDAASLDMSRIRVQSIFSARVHYNLYACFKIVTSHQRRHIWQMEQVHASLAAATSGG